MAKVRKTKSGTYSLMVSFCRRRCNLTLGKISESEAKAFSINMDGLIQHRKHRGRLPISPVLDAWIQTLSTRHRRQLSKIGLLSAGDFDLTVGEVIEKFLRDYWRRPLAKSSKISFTSAMEHRIPPFLKSKKLSEIEPEKASYRVNAEPTFSESTEELFESAEAWQRKRYAPSTWSRANGRLREVGVWAVKRGICDYNPFSLANSPGEVNTDRNVYVSTDLVEDAIRNCLDMDTRLSFILGRYAGIRMPSEALTLEWSHVDFEKRQLKILDSKKKKFRTMPLFDRLYDELIVLQEEGDKFVFSSRYRTRSTNFKLMKEAILRAGQTPWERIRQNLRTSCENDLLNAGFDERLVTRWVGHSVQISRKHYQHAKDEDYLDAIEKCRTAAKSQ